MIIVTEADHELEANRRWKLNHVAKAIVSTLNEEHNNDNREFTLIADRCLRNSGKERPTMATVMVALQFLVALHEQFERRSKEDDYFCLQATSWSLYYG
ncbi:hypothetical protein Tco_0607823 [Tanacetum coccineum]